MQKTILIVEDHTDSSMILRFLLEGNGFNVKTAKDGFEAIEMVRLEIPDLILMDLALPEVDGVTATKTIREVEGAENIPIFAMTAHWTSYYPEAKEAGLNGVLQKPLDHLKLLRLLKQWLAD